MPSPRTHPLALECEIKTANGWRVIGVEEARHTPEGSLLRCIACGGRLRVHRAFYGDGGAAFFKHMRSHTGCPHALAYCGSPSPHPEALR